MRLTLYALALIACLAADFASAQPASPVQGAPPQGHVASARNPVAPLIEQMRAGGLVLVIRHERTELPSREDDYTRPAHDCTAQRNLSVAGIAGAQETGAALRALDIAFGAILSSPMCRTTETARHMFGRYGIEPRLIHPNSGVPGGRDIEDAAKEFTEVLRGLSMTGGNAVLISHAGNIARATGLRLSEGEIGVIRIEADGNPVIIGQVLGSDLGAHARLALANASRTE